MKGNCSCGNIQFEMMDKPMFVHCCHCRMCQRQSGAAFALNALIEVNKVQHRSGKPEVIEMPSDKPQGQRVSRCPDCKTAVWSQYPSAGNQFYYVRVGTLENPDVCPPDIHIFTESKQPWVTLADDIPAVTQFYDREKMWPTDSLHRRQAALV